VTAWVPLGAVPAEDGPLFLVEGSHRFDDLTGPLRGLDVDAEGAPPGSLDLDPVALAAERGARLLTADFRAGDVVLFGMFMLHASFDNA
ncbi:phytanoyl-CoA dioxygenase family protein, partial [Priestia sp. SIMBA_032]|uniref:phytanoyl-CoA dioxygenase family protein n=1 Tax=Priestia sp. SIMBA_032 TaxID=3085775 RepID=UPI00397B376A